jgi:hypothetical protein
MQLADRWICGAIGGILTTRADRTLMACRSISRGCWPSCRRSGRISQSAGAVRTRCHMRKMSAGLALGRAAAAIATFANCSFTPAGQFALVVTRCRSCMALCTGNLLLYYVTFCFRSGTQQSAHCLNSTSPPRPQTHRRSIHPSDHTPEPQRPHSPA